MKLYDWQNYVCNYITEHDNGLLYLIDTPGGAGTTWFSRDYCDLHDEAVRVRSTNKRELKGELKHKTGNLDSTHVIFFDFFKTSRVNHKMLAELAESCIVVAFLKPKIGALKPRELNKLKVVAQLVEYIGYPGRLCVFNHKGKDPSGFISPNCDPVTLRRTSHLA